MSEQESIPGEGESSSTEENDLMVQSTKKVKTKDEEVHADMISMVVETPDLGNGEENMVTDDGDREMQQPKKDGGNVERQSYRDKLMNINLDEEEELILEALKDMGDVEWSNKEQEDKEMREEQAFNPCPSINMSFEEAEEWCRPWKQALIMRLLGKRIGLRTLQTRLEKDWRKKGPIKIIDLSDEYFLVHFKNDDDYKFALFEGPWKIQDHYLIVQIWRPFFKCGGDEIRNLVVWVRIPNLPIELCNATFLWRVGSTIGTMLKVDMLTSVNLRARFARICVEIDLCKMLVPKFKVLSYEFSLEYEGLHLICFKCGKYVHREEVCSEGHQSVETTSTAMIQEGTEVTGEEADRLGVAKEAPEKVAGNLRRSQHFILKIAKQDLVGSSHSGPWMLVKKVLRCKVNHDKGQIIGNQFPLELGQATGRRNIPQNKEPQNGLRFEVPYNDIATNEG